MSDILEICSAENPSDLSKVNCDYKIGRLQLSKHFDIGKPLASISNHYAQPIIPNSDMHGFYFAHPPFIDHNKLKTVTGTAKALIHLVPISKNELDFKNNNGTDALLELFGEKEVNPVFNLSRKCSI